VGIDVQHEYRESVDPVWRGPAKWLDGGATSLRNPSAPKGTAWESVYGAPRQVRKHKSNLWTDDSDDDADAEQRKTKDPGLAHER
jgi:hypothetical protein